MAEALLFVCSACDYKIEVWSDGNPYYIDDNGNKQYVHHPDERLALCIGVESPHICLACGERFIVDSEEPLTECPKCGSDNFVNTFYQLKGQRCPFCKEGIFHVDPKFRILS